MSLQGNIIRNFRLNDFHVSEQQAFSFAKFFELLTEYNAKTNLTAITEEDDVINKHFLDSLTSAHLIPQNASVLDVGSGAGFPGIPLKLYRPDIKLTLLEATVKKTNFLDTAIKALNLKNTITIAGRAEILGKGQLREKYDVVVSRAVGNLSLLLEYCTPFLKVGGIFIAYKGPNFEEELELSKRTESLLSVSLDNIVSKRIAQSFDRNLIVYKKNDHTAAEYPRTNKQIIKKPL